jgi:hypothetical protein
LVPFRLSFSKGFLIVFKEIGQKLPILIISNLFLCVSFVHRASSIFDVVVFLDVRVIVVVVVRLTIVIAATTAILDLTKSIVVLKKSQKLLFEIIHRKSNFLAIKQILFRILNVVSLDFGLGRAFITF